MYVIPRRSLELTILSCKGLPSIKADQLWHDERFKTELQALRRKCDEAQTRLHDAVAAAGGPANQLPFQINAESIGSPAFTSVVDYQKAVTNLNNFYAMYGGSAESDKRIAPNCYASVTLERNTVKSPLATTEVMRANYSVFWNCTTKDINIDLLLMCSDIQGAAQNPSYMYCQRLRIAVYHDFGFGQDANSTAWAHDDTRDGLLIGEAFIAVADLFAEPCAKRHELSVFGPTHTEIAGCKLHIETKVSCSKAQVPKVFPCASSFPAIIPIEAEKDCGQGCDADVSLNGSDSISLPAGVRLAMGSSRASCKHKGKSKCKSKCKSNHRC